MTSAPEKITAAWLNGLSIEDRIKVLQGPFGRNMHAWAASHITYFRWTRISLIGTRTVSNGTCFFIEFDKRLFAVTAAHVYDGFCEAKRKSGKQILCQIENIVFDPEVRLRGYNSNVDIATFDFTHEELIKTRKQAISGAPWPPPVPIENNCAFIGGFPGAGRLWLGPSALSFGLYLGEGPMTVVTDRQITCRFERQYWIKAEGFGMPPPGMDLGGISGGPLLIPLDNMEGVWSLYLAGVICQAQTSGDFETVVAVRAHFINSDGSISAV